MDHWPTFVEFCRVETLAGGPDPQLQFLADLSKDSSPVDRVWLAGCYGAHHVVLSAYVLWKQFSVHDVVADHEPLVDWLVENWSVLPIRPEMRSHRMLQKRAQCLVDFAHYAVNRTWESGSYQDVWKDSLAKVKYYGRYMASKYLDVLKRSVRPELVAPKMESRGAWSPRVTLSMLWPEVAVLADRGDTSVATMALVDHHLEATLRQLAQHGVHLDYFQLQVVLCEYKEICEGTFYSGKSHDEELEYVLTNPAYKSVVEHPFLELRSQVYPRWVLGEHNGWDGPRLSLLRAMPEHGYIWSDSVYCYTNELSVAERIVRHV